MRPFWYESLNILQGRSRWGIVVGRTTSPTTTSIFDLSVATGYAPPAYLAYQAQT